MFLKKIEIHGFKTFPDKTEVEFSPGVTAIVGPNGCGKSNIIDAMLWALGESNIRNLRGQKTTDIVFTGSEKRRGIGVAEVTLTMDNSDGTLPVAFAEVAVTRRVYRSGEAEYLINKSRCRLKDIYELFLDTGVGRQAYSVVSQGSIDAILSAKPEDRRELFEEAAGVKKYRYRRHEALKKLEQTQGNLQRVTDIMSELRVQIEPLAEQAEMAKRYMGLASELRDIEVGILIRDLRRFSTALEQSRSLRTDADQRTQELELLSAEMEESSSSIQIRIVDLEHELDTRRTEEHNLSAEVSKLSSQTALLEERIKAAEAARTRAGENIGNLLARIKQASERKSKLDSDLASAKNDGSQISLETAAAQQHLNDLTRRFNESNQIINDRKASYIQLARELAAKRNSLQHSRERIEQLAVVVSKIDASILALNTQRDIAANRQAEEEAATKWAVDELVKAEKSVASLAEEHKLVSQKLVDINRSYSELMRDIAARSSRLATLTEMSESHEGFYEGVRSVMSAARSGKLRGEFTVVADLVSVPKGYAMAVEVALGGSLQDIVCDTVNDAKSAIEMLKSARLGRATFLPLDNIRQSAAVGANKFAGAHGFLGIASELVECADRFRPVVNSLLGRTVVCDTVDNAVVISRQAGSWGKIVTLEGELIMPSGAITGGTVKGKGTGLLHRKQERDTLAVELHDSEKRVAEMRSRIEESENRIGELGVEARSARVSAEQIRTAVSESSSKSLIARADATRLARQIETSLRENEEMEELRLAEVSKVECLESELHTAGEENTELDKRVEEAEQVVSDIEVQRVQAREELMRVSVTQAAASERNAGLSASLEELLSSISEMQRVLDTERREAKKVIEEMGRLATESTFVRDTLAVKTGLLQKASEAIEGRASERTAQEERRREAERKLREAQSERMRLVNATRDADIREARLEMQISQSSERLTTEYEISLEQALECSEDGYELERGVASEVARLRREIREMGAVNTGAVQEYERMSERWEFLFLQKTDLENASSQLGEAVAEIDGSTRGVFMDTFKAISDDFELMFQKLFGGGATRLTLTDPSNLLETGVEVSVQLPGKRLQDMALLSGGEKALTAAALVFALLLARPSPFVVLDEVDAPLDERNVERFSEVLREFAQRSQFIVITHNRATMEAADYLYGVTMQEPGVSKVLSVKLTGELAVTVA